MFEAISPMIKIFAPQLVPMIPQITPAIEEFLVNFLKDKAKAAGKEKVLVVIDSVVWEGKEYAIIKYMYVENGGLKPLQTPEGKNDEEYAQEMLNKLINGALAKMNETDGTED